MRGTMIHGIWAVGLMLWAVSACSTDSGSSAGGGDFTVNSYDSATDEWLDGVFIQPFKSCVPPVAADALPSDDGEVCTNVAISGSTEDGRKFTDYGSCDVVLSQRPYWESEPKGVTAADDPRLSDSAFMAELAWMGNQVRASGCICCHDSTVGRKAAVWDVSADGIWTDQLGDQGIGILSGKVSSRLLGAFPAAENNGFDRDTTGFPTVDVERVKAFFQQELDRRGLTEAAIAALPEFGSFLTEILDAAPVDCAAEEGVAADGTVNWTGAGARYVYVTTPDAKNPGAPPNLDKPEGTIWMLGVKASAQPIDSGIPYGDQPDGTYQVIPSDSEAPALTSGETYKLYVLKDILLPLANCLFTAN